MTENGCMLSTLIGYGSTGGIAINLSGRMNELTGGTVCSVDAATGTAMGPSRTSRFNLEEQDTSMYLRNLGMFSALLIAGLLYGCGDSQQTGKVDFREKNYPADVASVSGFGEHEPGGRWTVEARAVLQFKKTLPSTFQLKLQTFSAFGPNAGIPILVRAGSVQKEFTVAGPNQLILLDFEGVVNADRIEFVIPTPTSPKELAINEDPRKLGLGLVSLAIVPKGGI